MCDCVPSTLPTYHHSIKIPNTRFTRFPPKSPTSPLLSNHLCYSSATRPSNSGLQFISLRFESNGPKSTNSRSSGSGSEEHEIYGELEFKPKQETKFEEQMLNNSSINNGRIDGLSYDEGGAFSGGDFLGNDEDSGTETSTTKGRLKDDDLVKIRGSDSDGGGLKIEELEKLNLRRGRQLMRRSNLIAKQVISLHSALTLGFVSQLWVDTNSWVVLIVEVRPSLLSGELERFLLEDISQVGDVVLIEDENVMENEFKMVGLETLVGYNVVTPGRRNIGKVRGFTFNINSGAVESLELDSFGISIIPSSLVSTYALFVEDVLEVVSDTVVVHEAAASRMQRLTKGFWNDQKVGNSIDELEEYSDLEREAVESEYGRGRKRRTGRRKSHPKMREIPDEWELPMDYL